MAFPKEVGATAGTALRVESQTGSGTQRGSISTTGPDEGNTLTVAFCMPGINC